jgi:CHASE2 domain-containing sensor protein
LRHALLAAAALAAAVIGVITYETGALNALERDAVDARFSIRGSEGPGGGIVIVGVDQKTLSAIDKQLPIPRVYYAELLNRLHAAHARLVAIDAQFTGTSQYGRRDDRALLTAVARDGPVVLATHDSSTGPVPVPAGVRNAPGAVLGSAAVDIDPDGVLRRMIYAAVRLPTFAVVAAQLLLHHPVSQSDFPGNHAWVDFRGPPGTFPTYSMIDVLDGRVPAADLAGKTVLVGVTDPEGKDVFVTAASSDPMAGVEFQANSLLTILNGFPLGSASGAVEILLVLVLAAIPALLSLRLPSLFVLLAAVVVLAVFLIAAQLAFDGGTILSVPDPVLALALATAGSVAAESFVQRRQLRELRVVLDLVPGPSDFFISYRRGQSELAANTLRDGLARKFGEAHVFMDTDAIEPGEHWPQRIEDAIAGSRAMLVVIGPQWLDVRTPDGGRRLDDPGDWVRREVAGGLANEKIVVIPVLHDGAEEPPPDRLPDPLKPLASCQAVHLTGRDIDRWVDELAERIHKGRIRQATAARQPVGERPVAASQPDH